jgi:hypothetical protein
MLGFQQMVRGAAGDGNQDSFTNRKPQFCGQ